MDARFKQIQGWTKNSLLERHYGSHKGRMWLEEGHSIPEDIVNNYLWVRRTPTSARKNHQFYGEKPVTSLLVAEETGTDVPLKVLLKGGLGSGKSTALKHIAQGWAKGTVEELKQFDLVFYVALNPALRNEKLENIIINQHKEIQENKVQPEEIKDIVEGISKKKVLLLLDGYDLYTINDPEEQEEDGEMILGDIDNIIQKKGLLSCWVILASTESNHLDKIKDFMDAEAQMAGFTFNEYQQYATKYLGNEGLFRKFNNSDDLNESQFWEDPLLLHMACVLFRDRGSLPTDFTGFLSAIFNRSVNWPAIRKSESDVEKAKSNFWSIGQMAFYGLKDRKFNFTKESVPEYEETFGLNLLVPKEGTEYLNFQHVALQKFAAAKFLADAFPSVESWGEILHHKDELLYACSMTNRPDTLVSYVGEVLADDYIQNGYDNTRGDSNFLKALKYSMHELRVIDPLHNQQINFVSEQDAYRHVYIPSRYYVFDTLMEDEPLEGPICRSIPDGPVRYNYHNEDSSSMKSDADCAIFVEGKQLKRSLQLLKDLSQFQNVMIGRLRLVELDEGRRGECDDELIQLMFENFSLSPRAKSVEVVDSKMPLSIYEVLMRQLTNCADLEKLVLRKNTVYARMKMDKTVAKLESLKELNLYDCDISSYDCEALMEVMPLSVEILDMSKNTMTRCLDALIQPSGRQAMRKLLLKQSELDKHDLNSLGEALSSNLLPNLEELDVSGNKLEGSDLQSLFRALREQKVPRLKKLVLSLNSLTGTLQDLIGKADHFQTLEELHLERTDLNEEDVVELLDAIKKDQFPSLNILNLEWNQMEEKVQKTIVKDLIKTCITTYGSNVNFHLLLGYNSFCGDYAEELREIGSDMGEFLSL